MSIEEEAYNRIKKILKAIEYECQIRKIIAVGRRLSEKEPFIDKRYSEEWKNFCYIEGGITYFPYSATVFIEGEPLNYKYFLN